MRDPNSNGDLCSRLVRCKCQVKPPQPENGKKNTKRNRKNIPKKCSPFLFVFLRWVAKLHQPGNYKGLRPLPPTPGREGELTHTSLPEPTRKLYGYESKYKVWIKAPKLHTIHTPRSILWSIPLIHTPDPYPFLVEERLMLALTMLFILIYTASGRRTATPIATTVASDSTAASTASAAAAAATTSDYPPRIGPAAGSPYCQTLLSELPRN